MESLELTSFQDFLNAWKYDQVTLNSEVVTENTLAILNRDFYFLENHLSGSFLVMDRGFKLLKEKDFNFFFQFICDFIRENN